MQNSVKTLTLIFIAIGYCFAASNSASFNLYTPSSLEKDQICFSIRHRFYGDAFARPFENLFGMDDGANTYLGLRYQFIDRLELKAAYTRSNKEKLLGLSYLLPLEEFPLFAQISIDYISFNNPALTEKNRANIVAVASLSNKALLDRFSAIMNFGYDGYFKRVLFAPGLIVKLRKDPDIFRDVSAIFEYYPVLDRKTAGDNLKQYLQPDNALFFGIRLNTYGHCFLFSVSNATDFHPRRLSLGCSASGDWRLGFNIERILYL